MSELTQINAILSNPATRPPAEHITDMAAPATPAPADIPTALTVVTDTAASVPAATATTSVPSGKLTPAELASKYGEAVSVTDKGAIQWSEIYYAAKFAQEMDILHSPEVRAFYLYDTATGVWGEETDAKLKTRLYGNVFAHVKKSYSKFHFSLTESKLKALAAHLQGLVEVRDAFDRPHGLIHVKNGMVDLSSGTPVIKPFDKAYRSRNQSPLDYNPAATCPRFLTELLGAAVSPDDIDLLQRWSGSLLLGGNAAQRIMTIHGTAGSGKSTFMSVIEAIIGEHNIGSLNPERLAERFERSMLIGKQLLVGKDVSSTYLEAKAVNQLKSLTGGDRLTAEVKNGRKPVLLRGNFGVVVTSNAPLVIKLDNDSDAWKRRLLNVAFTGSKPAKPIPNFDQLLVNLEGEGILAWMIQGAVKHLTELKTTGTYALSLNQEDRITEMIGEASSIMGFLDTCVIAGTGNITSEELTDAYEAYCAKKGWMAQPAKTFQEEVKERIGRKFRVGQSHDIHRRDATRRGYRNIELKKTPVVAVADDDVPF